MRKYLESAVAAAEEAEVGDEEEEEEESFALASLSSSFIVSNMLDALCLMTLIYCGGATSEINLAILRELAIVLIFLGNKQLAKKESIQGFVVDEHEQKCVNCDAIYKAMQGLDGVNSPTRV